MFTFFKKRSTVSKRIKGIIIGFYLDVSEKNVLFYQRGLRGVKFERHCSIQFVLFSSETMELAGSKERR